VKVACQVLARILDDAVRDRMLATNPARGVKRPRPQPKRKPYLSAEQLSMLAEEAGEYRGLVLLLGIGGLRWGEAIPIRVCDIDWLPRRVNLHRNVTQVRGKMIEGSLKSHKNRFVVVPPFVVEAIAVTAEGKGREDLLWPSPSGGYLHPQREGGWLSKAVGRCQKADPTFPRVTAHDLRHTAVSLAIHAGANVKAIQRMVGHASAAMTLDVYADLFESDLDSVAENVAKLWPQEAKKDTSSF
jgi:integrase